MIDKRRAAQASRYVLGNLPAHELGEFEAALRADARLQLLVKELRGISSSMPVSVVSSPPATKESGLASLSPSPATVPEAPTKSASWISWTPWVLSSGFAVVCLMLISLTQTHRQRVLAFSEQVERGNREIAELRRQIALLQAAMAEKSTNYQQRAREAEGRLLEAVVELNKQTAAMSNQLWQQLTATNQELATLRRRSDALAKEKKLLEQAVADAATQNNDRFSIATLAVLRPTADGAPSGVGTVLWSPQDQRGLLLAENLPPLAATQAYQLWLADATRGAIVSGGLLPAVARGAIRVQFRTDIRIETLQRAFLTVELAVGAASPTGRTVLSSQ